MNAPGAYRKKADSHTCCGLRGQLDHDRKTAGKVRDFFRADEGKSQVSHPSVLLLSQNQCEIDTYHSVAVRFGKRTKRQKGVCQAEITWG